MFKKIKSLMTSYRGLGYVSLGNLVGNLIGSLFWIYLASFVSTDFYGETHYFIVIGSFSAVLLLFGLPIFMTTFLAKGISNIRSEIYSLALLLVSVGSITLFFLFQSLSLSLFLFGSAFFAISLAEMLGLGKDREYAIAFIGQKITNFVLSLTLYFILGIDGILYGFAISFLIFSYRGFLSLRYLTLSFLFIKEKKNILFHTWGFNVSKVVGFSADKLLIAPIFGFAVLGVYQLGIQFLLLEAMIPNILFAYLLREESKGVNRKQVKVIGVCVTVLLSLLGFLLAPFVVPELFPNFENSIPVIQITIWGGPILALNYIFTTEFIGKEKTKPIILSAITFVIVLYGLMLSLGNIFGSAGLASSLLIALCIELLLLYYFKVIYYKI